MLTSFDTLNPSYKDIFVFGHPFKSLYAVHVLTDYLESKKRPYLMEQRSSNLNPVTMEEYTKAGLRALSLVVAAFSDPEVIESCPTSSQRRRLCAALVNFYFRILKGGTTTGCFFGFSVSDTG